MVKIIYKREGLLKDFNQRTLSSSLNEVAFQLVLLWTDFFFYWCKIRLHNYIIQLLHT